MTLLQQSEAVLCDAQYYLARLSAEEYQQGIPLLSQSTLGQHTRHYIEFYQCLIHQLPSGTVNYDLRLRDTRIEQDPKFAEAAIKRVKEQLIALPPVVSLTLAGTITDNTDGVATNLARELIYNIEHTIHHLAIIKIGLKLIRPDLGLPESFGIAPSTLAHRKEQLCAAK
ncbi:MAG: hypothetical protein AAGA62_19350 [Bacteroidota bacterium]